MVIWYKSVKSADTNGLDGRGTLETSLFDMVSLLFALLLVGNALANSM